MKHILRTILASFIFSLIAMFGIVDWRLAAQHAVETTEEIYKKGTELYDQGRVGETEALYKRSLEVREKLLGPDSPGVAELLNNLATIYQIQGRYGDAESLYKRSLSIQEKVRGLDDPEIALPLNNLARLYVVQARYKDAEPLIKRALAIREKAFGFDHLYVARSLQNLALLYRDQHRYDDAEPLYKRSLSIMEKVFGPDHPNVTVSLNGLGALYQTQGRYSEAESLYQRSLTIVEKANGPDHLSLAVPLNNLAGIYVAQRRYVDAEPLLRRSLSIESKALGRDNPSVAETLSSLAVLFHSRGLYEHAEPLYKQSLAINEKFYGPDHPQTARSLNNLARLYSNQQRHGDALSIVERTITSRRAAEDIAFATLFTAEKSNLIDQTRSFADSYKILQFTSQSAAGDAVAKLAQRYAARNDDLAILIRKDQDLGAENDRIDRAIVAAVSKTEKERDAANEVKMHRRIAEIFAERNKIQLNLNQKFPGYVALANPQPLMLQETQMLLADDEAVVAFHIGENGSYAWVITRTDSFWTEIPTTTERLNDQVRQLRQSLTFRSEKPFDTLLANKIYRQTFEPIAAKVIGKKRLSVVANGALTSIPFGLLVTSDPTGKSLKSSDWLIKSFAITIVPSIYSLKTMRDQSALSSAAKPMIAFADPVFSKEARRKAQPQQATLRSLPSLYQGSQIDIKAIRELLPQLDGTRKEVQAIAKDLGAGPIDLKFGLDASESSVKRAKLDEYKIVYFATHALVSGELAKFTKARAEPALALTIPDNPTELDDGLLQASEISQLKLNADWVVLSACNTAAADSVGAEALSGLARGFLYAGARSLIVSHWDVDDEATAALMSKLFNIAKAQPHLSHGEALQQAILYQLSHSEKDGQAHPRYWAPFIVVGEPVKTR